jgi:hypothetical protein
MFTGQFAHQMERISGARFPLSAASDLEGYGLLVVQRKENRCGEDGYYYSQREQRAYIDPARREHFEGSKGQDGGETVMQEADFGKQVGE